MWGGGGGGKEEEEKWVWGVGGVREGGGGKVGWRRGAGGGGGGGGGGEGQIKEPSLDAKQRAKSSSLLSGRICAIVGSVYPLSTNEAKGCF